MKKIQALGELTEEEFEQVKDAVKDPVCRKRAKHAVYENQRTIQAVKALKNNDLETFGKLMNESHVSLRDDYEVTGKRAGYPGRSCLETGWSYRFQDDRSRIRWLYSKYCKGRGRRCLY